MDFASSDNISKILEEKLLTRRYFDYQRQFEKEQVRESKKYDWKALEYR